MAATKQNPIIFFDIPSKVGPWSPNTWKTRLALNYKRIPYRVEYVSYPDIEPTLKKLGVPPIETSAPLYTLPVIADPSSNPDEKPTYVGDSLRIALYLEDKYPSPTYPSLFPPGTRAFHSLFTEQFTPLKVLFAPSMLPLVGSHGFLDERGEEYYRRTREIRVGKPLEELAKDGVKGWDNVREKWDAFGKHLDANAGAGPFVMGKQIAYADFVIGAVFCWIKVTEEGGDRGLWKDISTWQNGRWENLWVEVEKVAQNSSEVSG